MNRNECETLFRLDGRVAVLTGAAGHLGSTMGAALAAAGARVFLLDREAGRVEQLAARIAHSGGRAEPIEVDLLDELALRKAVLRIGTQSERIDVLVNNAHAGDGGTLLTATGVEFERSYRIGVIVPFLLLQEARPWLRKAAEVNAGGASIINVGSMYGLVSPDFRIYDTASETNPPFYGAAKAALLQMTRYAACQLAPEKIRVNALTPGPFPSPSVQAAKPDFIRRLEARTPLGRIGRPEDLAGALLFLASDASAYVTGANLVVDGGWTAW